MELNEWLTLVAIVLGPIAAVAISLGIQSYREKRERRMIVVRMLMATRHLPGDPNYSHAINLIPVEFFDEPKVVAAFKDYSRAIRQERPLLQGGATKVDEDVIRFQTKLLSALLESLGMRVSEADLASEAYAADGMVKRDILYLESLDAQKRIAAALERSADG